jgi:hypothetical protein
MIAIISVVLRQRCCLFGGDLAYLHVSHSNVVFLLLIEIDLKGTHYKAAYGIDKSTSS